MPSPAPAPEKVRTIALAGHRSCGKTTLGDALLCVAGVTRQMGNVDDGSSLLDHGPEERRRRMTLGMSFCWLEWQEHLLYLVDTPGVADLSHERSLALHSTDAVLLVVDGSSGIERGTREVMELVQALDLPCLVVVNRVDRIRDLDGLCAELASEIGRRGLVIQRPFQDEEGQLQGVLDNRTREALRFDPEGSGRLSREPVPARYRQAMQRDHDQLVEAVAMTDDALLEAYLESFELPLERIRAGMVAAVRSADLLPVYLAESPMAIGAATLLDAVVELAPSPVVRPMPMGLRDGDGHEGLAAQHIASRLDDSHGLHHMLRVWRGDASGNKNWLNPRNGLQANPRRLYAIRGPRRATARYTGPGAIVASWAPLPTVPGDTWLDRRGVRLLPPPVPAPMVGRVIRPVGESARERMEQALGVLRSLDRGLHIERDPLTGSVVLRGQGETHLARAIGVIRDRLGVDLLVAPVPVHYREVPVGEPVEAMGVHRHMQASEELEFAQCTLRFRPASPEEGVVFVSRVGESVLPARFVSGIEDGVRRALRHGPMARYPVIGVEVACVDGEYNVLRSEVEHFEEAGYRAATAALARCTMAMYEPWLELQVCCPAEMLGAALAEITGHEGRIADLEVGSNEAVVRCECPERVLVGFSRRLRGATAGRGRYTRRAGPLRRLAEGRVAAAVAASPFQDTPGAEQDSGPVPTGGAESIIPVGRRSSA